MTLLEEIAAVAKHFARVAAVGAVLVALAVGAYFAFGQSAVQHAGLDVAVPDGLPASTLSDSDVSAMLKAHNDLRAQFGQQPLTWSPNLASLAQDWANQMATSGGFNHRPNNQYGENLYVGGFNGDTSPYGPADAVNSWASEVAAFDATTNTCPDFNQCGHFTQVVWGTTTQVGCARAVGKNNDWGDSFKADYWVCNYSPAGNMTNGNDNSVKPFA